MRPVPLVPVFPRRDLIALGWSDPAIARAVRAGRLHRVRRGLLTAGQIDHEVEAVAAALACAGSAVSHRSALLLDGLPLVGSAPRVPELTVPPRCIGSLARAHLYRATLPKADIDVRAGIPVTTVARTLIDVARHRPTLTAVAAMDAALNRGLVAVSDIEDVVLRCWNWPRIARAAKALRLVDPRAESPLESVSRVVIGWLQLPPPRTQVEIYDDFGHFVARVDFYWDRFGVVGEADGRGKYDDRSVLVQEKLRQEELEQLGLVVVRWGWSDAVYQRAALRARCLRAFERALARDRSGFRGLWSVPDAKPD